MAHPLTSQAFGPPADVGIWVWVEGNDALDTYRLTTLGEFWGDLYADNTQDWQAIFDGHGEDVQLYGFGEDPCQ